MTTTFKKLFNPKAHPPAPPTAAPSGPLAPSRPSKPANSPRILIIGAGSRGQGYANLISGTTGGTIVAVAEPDPYKRSEFAAKHSLSADLVFTTWHDVLASENQQKVIDSVDGICICTLDETHEEIVLALSHLNKHTLCEKPLSTSLQSCIRICNTVTASGRLFAVGHVLRYSPHNRLLRKLVCEEGVIGEVITVNHTEPVGWYHFAHSYVRGNWRKTQTSAPSLLTKCCHDVDLLFWLLCSTTPGTATPHLPARVSSFGSLVHFRQSQKPTKAGSATNCLSCEAEPDCLFSAKKIYLAQNLRRGNMGWPVKIVVPDIEDAGSFARAEEMVLGRLGEDFGDLGEKEEEEEEGKEDRTYYGRCVYECDNDVVDNQVVTISWEGETPSTPGSLVEPGRGGKTATLTMVAFSEKICQRFTRVYGTKGELEADSDTIKVYDFATEQKKVWRPAVDVVSGHGGGDGGLVRAFVDAIDKVKNEGWEVERAQVEVLGVTVEETLRSHAAVFWAEEARVGKRVLEWEGWWRDNVAGSLAL